MTVDEAIRHLAERARRRCDAGNTTKVYWSLEDVTAINTLTAAVEKMRPPIPRRRRDGA